MRLAFPHRLFVVLVTLISLLFTQAALATYVCPAPSPSNGVAMQKMVADLTAAKADDMHKAMPGCAHQDPVQPNLCVAHYHAGQQSLDKPPSPNIPPFLPARLVVMTTPVEIGQQTLLPAHRRSSILAHALAPPLAIRHCCFRI